jgi:CubicO group peptidase (beta-lactamase class C family)
MPRENLHAAWIARDGSTGDAGSLSAFFPWWSFTKTVLAICALRLVEGNRLSLDVPRPGKPYTLRQLLQHTAGVPNYGSLAAYHQAVARHETPWSRDKLLEALGRDRLDFPPGAGWNYSNVGYMFVREAIEEATGASVANALRTMIFGPLGIRNVRFATAPSDFEGIFWDELRSYDPRWVYHGCLVGTPRAAVNVLHALFSGAILTPASLDAMLQRYELGGALPGRPWTRCGYGLGLMCGEMGAAKTAIGHSGGGPFGANAVYHYPDLDMPVTVATFTAGTQEGAAEHEAAAIALAQQKAARR